MLRQQPGLFQDSPMIRDFAVATQIVPPRADNSPVKLLKSIHYRQFSIIIRSLDCSSTCGNKSHLPSLDTGSPPTQSGRSFSSM